MRHLASLPDAGQAENFGDYLTTQGIANSREPGGGHWTIWVEREDQIDQARKELQQFQQEPGADRYQNASRTARAFEAVQDQLAQRRIKDHVDFRLGYAQAEASDQKTFPATVVLVAVCVLVAMISNMGNDYHRLDGFFFVPAGTPIYFGGTALTVIREVGVATWGHALWLEATAIRQGQLWRIITPIFVHFGVWHLFFDMWWLWELGRLVEKRKGTPFYLILVFVSAAISNIAEYAWNGPAFFGGMSGVVYALFGYIWMKGLFQPQQRMVLPQQVIWIMLGWLVVCMSGLFAKVVGDVANACHLIGLIVGVIFGITPWAWIYLRRQLAARAAR